MVTNTEDQGKRQDSGSDATLGVLSGALHAICGSCCRL
jgi:hypothetical protein